MFTRGTWMSAGYIAQAIKILREIKENPTRTKNERDGSDEGIACLTSAKPEYLCNLIKTDHPDRIMAMHLLTT
jgi:hypothetical protein